MARKRKKSLLRKLIGRGYKGLSLLNTTSIVLSGDPVRIAKHLSRKRTVKLASGLIPGTKR